VAGALEEHVRDGIIDGGLLGNLLVCIGGREETGRPFIAKHTDQPTGSEGGVGGRWTRLGSRSAVVVGRWGSTNLTLNGGVERVSGEGGRRQEAPAYKR